MTRIKIIASLTMLAAIFTAAGQSQEKTNGVVPVKYDGLKQEILKHRGKVLVVDFWAGT